jgi:hypothetical protein
MLTRLETQVLNLRHLPISLVSDDFFVIGALARFSADDLAYKDYGVKPTYRRGHPIQPWPKND